MKLVLCDDHGLFVEAMAAALRAHGVDVAAVCSQPALLVPLAETVAPDICLLDVSFPDEDGIAAIGRILRACPTTSVVMCSAATDASAIAAALAAGARGFLSKTLDLAVIVAALARVGEGEIVVLSSRPARPVVPEQRTREAGEGKLLGYLTGREHDVLRRLMRGDSTDNIADALGTARSTTRTHIQNVLAKLGTHSRREAVAFAARQGIQPLPLPSDPTRMLALRRG
jgi:two-component system, NarL family, nitrate/nitrite response regulator NarL